MNPSTFGSNTWPGAGEDLTPDPSPNGEGSFLVKRVVWQELFWNEISVLVVVRRIILLYTEIGG